MADAPILSFGVLNYSGMLFNKGNTKTPFTTLVGGRRKVTNHVAFTTGQEFTTAGGTQPAITETDSLTAPFADYVTRAQKENVTQIFQEALYISYSKLSNMGTMSGLNISNQGANPVNELDFQVAAKMAKIGRDIEYTCINGVYQKAANDVTANKTRGMLSAITSNVYNMDGRALRVWDIALAMKLIYEAQGPTSGLVAWVDPVALFQLNADAEQNGLTIVPAGRNMNGIAISTLLTPMGEIGLYLGEFLPAGTVMIFNPDVISLVEQPVPNKGNFFMEELAKVGAGTKMQIFGQMGLDHGPEWFHAKISNINTDFVIPPAGKKIYAVDPIPTAEVLPVLSTVTLGGTPTVGDATDALVVAYTGTPTSAPTLAYKWKISTTQLGTYTDISGATSATYTPDVADAGKWIKCEVTATVTAAGKVLSNAKVVAEA